MDKVGVNEISAAHAMPDVAEAFPNPWANAVAAGGGKGERRGKGRGKGKGKAAAGPRGERHGRGRGGWDNEAAPDFSSIEEARRAELEGRLEAFHAGSAASSAQAQTAPFPGELTFAADLSALERRFVHSVAERLGGLVAHGVGAGAARHIVVTRRRDGQPEAGDINPARRAEFQVQLQALQSGTQPGAVPRPGDHVKVLRVLGPDRKHLEGRVGEVLGAAPLAALQGAGGAFTVHFPGDGAAFGDDGLNLTVAASDLLVFEAKRPLAEASLAFPKTLTGLERKVFHEIGESLGLISQSFGEGQERYITVYRRAESDTYVEVEPTISETTAATTTVNEGVNCSGIQLDDDSHAALLRAVGPLPEGWCTFGQRMVVCCGPLAQPRDRDRRSVAESLMVRIAELGEGDKVKLRVVSFAKSARVLAVGVLGVPAIARNPHIVVAVAPGLGPWEAESLSEWSSWSEDALELHGSVEQWRRASGGVAYGGGQ